MTTEFGKVIRKLRIDADVTMAVMAAEMGVSPSFLSQVESGNKLLSPAWAEKIYDYFAAKFVRTDKREFWWKYFCCCKHIDISGLPYGKRSRIALHLAELMVQKEIIFGRANDDA